MDEFEADIIERFGNLPNKKAKLRVLKELMKDEPLWPFDFCSGCAEAHVDDGPDVDNTDCECSCHG